jgi:hypothetical protein
MANAQYVPKLFTSKFNKLNQQNVCRKNDAQRNMHE